MEEQFTLRLPRELARALGRAARQRRVPKSQLVREAIQGYLAAAETDAGPIDAWQRIAPFVGSVQLDSAAAERDALIKQIRAHNWRE